MAACHFILKVSSVVETREQFDDLVTCDSPCVCVFYSRGLCDGENCIDCDFG